MAGAKTAAYSVPALAPLKLPKPMVPAAAKQLGQPPQMVQKLTKRPQKALIKTPQDNGAIFKAAKTGVMK